MGAVRVMHFSDTHFGVEALGRLDPVTGLNTRLVDFRTTLEAAIDDALSRGIHLAVFTGDAYKTRDPGQTQQREFAACIRRFGDVPVVLLPGNHDAAGVKGRANAVEIYRILGVRNVTVPTGPERIVVETAAGPVQIAAMPYLVRAFVLAREDTMGKAPEQVREMLERRYRDFIAELASRMEPGVPAILLGHVWIRDARVSGRQPEYLSPNEPQLAVADVAHSAFDYVGLGHIHRHQAMNPGGAPPVVYAGSPDRIDFGEHDEAKGWVLVELEPGSARWEFVPSQRARPFIDIEVDAENDSPTETITAAVARRNLRDSIVRLTYKISPERDTLVRMREVRDALAPAFLVAGIRRISTTQPGARSASLTEGLDPRAALRTYLEQAGKSEQRREELLRYADGLFDELRAREVLG